MANQPGESNTDLESLRLQAEYMERLRRLLRRAPTEVREDTLREVRSHIEDEWQALGGDLTALRTVLHRLGPPEEYGRDLALQLILMSGGKRRSPGRLVLAAIFWASTSLLGGVVLIGSTIVFVFTTGMLFTAVVRALGIPVMLFDARQFQFFHYRAEQVSFPPLTWSPALIGIVGLLPAVLIFAGLYRFLSLWVHSRMAQAGLALVTVEHPPVLSHGWERRAMMAMFAFAVIGLSSCVLLTMLSQVIPIGHPGTLRLPDDFFRTPLTALAFIGGLVFLVSPVLGLLWAAKRTTS